MASRLPAPGEKWALVLQLHFGAALSAAQVSEDPLS